NNPHSAVSVELISTDILPATAAAGKDITNETRASCLRLCDSKSLPPQMPIIRTPNKNRDPGTGREACVPLKNHIYLYPQLPYN
ncbi:MAG: hypothetical protein ACYTEU_13405, partial [Planctomycetota bacterium]